ncbi:hypothetical protein [Anaeromicropila populeti]|uniref:Phage tail tube protein n=1 Tax=Anaeromicropila populeti TaxID=37658 RepID=A0A1I6LRL7_9FIRM|nr:hypothetical protein [Anaeromicropila populeti]SFS06068.1 hypothetical protein SAMN05661086_03509 [Anaeromicropila populeti]
MSFIQYLYFQQESLPLPEQYSVQIADVEADSSGETEAGTTQTDLVRMGVHTIEVTFSVSAKWAKKLAQFRSQKSISVQYFDTETLSVQSTCMRMQDFSTELVKDTSGQGLWKVSFTLKEL